MAEADEFDTDLEQEVTDEEFESTGEEGTAAPAPKKSGGGFMFKAVVLLAAIGAGGFFLARAGLLPISIPGLTPVKVQQAQKPLAPPPSADGSAEMAQASQVSSAAPAAVTQELPTAIGAPVSAPLAAPPQPQAADPFGDIPPQQTSQAAAQTLPVDPFAAETALAPVAPAAAEAKESDVHVTAAEITPAVPDEAKAPTVPELEMKEAPIAPVQSAALPAAGQEEVAALQGRLDTLEKRLGDLEAHMATNDDISAMAKSLKDLEKSLEKLSARKVTAGAPETSAAPTKRMESSKESLKPVAEKAAVPAKAETQWILRSAKPGTAWVSERGSSELKTVTVGDVLPGIGKITAIFKDSTGHWVVKGVQGSVNQ